MAILGTLILISSLIYLWTPAGQPQRRTIKAVGTSTLGHGSPPATIPQHSTATGEDGMMTQKTRGNQ
ncbi:protein of unknown function [Nitrospira japonica]|uniref:Uncharacterized protein n=2 Tax=Nitrospira japonica TaxID=1325564 RepID=A0A1W1I9P9_9BACT|nr:protein of unknown function [Nitrospira japonica]